MSNQPSTTDHALESRARGKFFWAGWCSYRDRRPLDTKFGDICVKALALPLEAVDAVQQDYERGRQLAAVLAYKSRGRRPLKSVKPGDPRLVGWFEASKYTERNLL